MTLLGVNIDHVATLRQARQEGVPDLLEAALAAIAGGAEGITVHLREDRRHIQDEDVRRLKREIAVPLNLEMAAAEDIIRVAETVGPAWACLVPEKRQELTTEGGLDLDRNPAVLAAAVKRLKAAGVRVSLFVEPTGEAARKARELGADAVELHTGTYAGAWKTGRRPRIENELARLGSAAQAAERLGLLVNAGHGISYENVEDLSKIYPFHEYNIGFSIVARAVFVGMKQAVSEMKEKIGTSFPNVLVGNPLDPRLRHAGTTPLASPGSPLSRG